MAIKVKPHSPLLSSPLRKKISSSYYLRFNFVSAWLSCFIFLAFFLTILYLFICQDHFYQKPQYLLFRSVFKQKNEFEIRFKNIRLPYSFRVQYETPCSKPTKLLILVMTRRNAFIQRDSIRRTWANSALIGTVIRFLIGDPSENDAKNGKIVRKEQKELEKEFRRFGDLIFLDGIVDSYQNLHLKWYAALQWQQNFCENAEFVLKTDDDTVVHLPRLDHWIERRFRPALKRNGATYFGWIISGVKPIREKGHRWFVPKSAFPEEWYPPYVQGATYLASAQAIRAVMAHAHEVDGFNMDDVLFTGVLAKLANVTLYNAGAHFRVGNSLGPNEKCVDGFPEAVALYGAENLAQFEEIHHKLEGIECNKSTV